MAKFLVYFENAQLDIWLPPNDEIPTPKGFVRKECNSLADLDRVYARLQTAQRIRQELAAMRDEAVWRDPRARVRESLIARMHSAAIGEWEREFIRLYLQLSDERKKEYYRKQYELREVILESREFDKPRNPEEVLGESL